MIASLLAILAAAALFAAFALIRPKPPCGDGGCGACRGACHASERNHDHA